MFTIIAAIREAYKETGARSSATLPVPAMIGAMMFFKGEWKRPGVSNVEEFNRIRSWNN